MGEEAAVSEAVQVDGNGASANGTALAVTEPKQEPGFWGSVGSWLASYWMWLAGGAVAAGGVYAAYRYLGSEEEEK